MRAVRGEGGEFSSRVEVFDEQESTDLSQVRLQKIVG